MKIFVVIGSVSYEFSEALGVFSTEVLAQSAVERAEKIGRWDSVHFEEFELDDLNSLDKFKG